MTPALLTKPVNEITASNIRALVASSVPEGERVEFKGELPAKTGQDPWMIDQKRIGDHAKNQILKEMVALANAFGGVLVLGIEEDSRLKPATASGIHPVPKCADLANRFQLIFRDRVEPQLPPHDIFPVVTKGAEDGVVVFRVPRSRLAPHRITRTRICPIRRSDRSEEMTMREIQDMTINVSLGLERLHNRFRERAGVFEREFACLTSPDDAYGVRITAAPVGDEIRLPRLCRPHFRLIDGLETPNVTVTRQFDGREPTVVRGLTGIHRAGQTGWHPRLRAVRSHQPDDLPTLSYNAYLELHCDGLVEFGWLSAVKDVDSSIHILFSDYVLPELAKVACWADALRRYADASAAEYAVQIAVHVAANRLFAMPGAERRISPHHLAGVLSRGVTAFPKYSFSEVSGISDLLIMCEHDLCNAGGQAFHDTDLGNLDVQVLYRP